LIEEGALWQVLFGTKMQQQLNKRALPFYTEPMQSRAMEDALRKETFLIVFMEAYLLRKR
jgi:hypothetical protein